MFRIITLSLPLAMLPLGIQAKAPQSDNYWLIGEVTGRWEYRVGSEKVRTLTGPYDPIRPEGQVRCLEPDLHQCELRFLTNARTDATARLPVKLVETGGWVSLKTLKPPQLPVLPGSASELAKKFIRATSAGGSRAASGCGGSLALRAPACGENIDISTFTIRWSPLSSGNVVILVERADGEAARFRGNASGQAGEFKDPSLDGFLRKIQSQSNPVDISVRVMGESGKEALRLVRVPPSSHTDDFEDRIRTVGTGTSVPTIVTRMTLALAEGMWSRAADEATVLISRAAGTVATLEYSLVGICQSDFEDQRALLHQYVHEPRYSEICSPTAVPETAAPSAPVTPPAADAAASSGTKTRTGIALVIGNYDYWNTPLNSVKADLQIMTETLRSLGFAVNTRENLRNPRQFVDTLDEVLRKEAATPDDVLVVYYSGHGLQLDGKPQLLSTGVSATARVAEDLRDNAESAQDLLEHMEQSIPNTRVLIIEACRNEPLSPAQGTAQAVKGGIAFQQDDVPNTFVMFANKPGLTTPVRSDYGLRGPFTEALAYALENSTDDITAVFELAKKKTAEISPGQEPMLYHSKNVVPVALTRASPIVHDARAKELLNNAENAYRAHAWQEFSAAVTRARVLASSTELQTRLANESDFVQAVMKAEAAELSQNWPDAAVQWQKARDLFVSREWVAMKAAVAWLLADDLFHGISALATLAAQSDSETAVQARRMVADLTTSFPSLKADADAAARGVDKRPVVEFERIQHED